ncbi:aminoacylase-1-like [Bicyclus anynana]|uniref:N-acyl-aliphatic-L-amino acid amidohydrolase n=1 Tax=Bicyclus anynana TaxID=110368 RepID=A0ABM3LKG3_BICAN|nr:aminoacylase-1-like [Bicyclus anynana]
MAQSQFALSWESYKSNVCSGFSSFQQNGELVDMTLAADGHLVKVHQVLIALASPYLKQLIVSVPTQHPVIFLNNVSHPTLSLILEYIYTGEVRVAAENLSAFMDAAKSLHIRGLENITDSGSSTTRTETSMNQSNMDTTRSFKKIEQILPPNAKKIFVNVSADSGMVAVEQANVDDSMHDYSDRMDDTEHDFDYDDDDDNKTVDTPSKTDHETKTAANVGAQEKLDKMNLQFTVSIRGALQIILNRYIYNLHSSQSTGVRRWRCIDYRNRKCLAFVTTQGNVVLNRANPHNHSFHDKKIIDKIEKNAVYSAIDDVKDLENVKTHTKKGSDSSDFVSLVIIMLLYYFLLILPCAICGVLPEKYIQVQGYKCDPAVKKLQEYIRIDTSKQENVDLSVQFWRREAAKLGLPFKVYRPGRLPVCITTLEGNKPDLPSILLNSHSDVVPVDAELWTYPPFSGHIDDNGILFGRGTQDTKGVSIQYMEAIRRLIEKNVTLDRTVHVMVVPDEETGSFDGLIPFLKTDDFKSLNIGFALDEGITSTDDTMFGTYVDKRPWQMQFNLQGASGHGSSIQKQTVMEQVQTLINMAMEYRNQQLVIMSANSPIDYGSYSTLNMNMLNSGIANNVIPSKASAVMDIRLSVDQNISDFEALIDSWLAKLGNKTTIKFIRRVEKSAATVVDESNTYWVALRDTVKGLGFKIVPAVCPATSDMLLLREIGIPAIGFSSRTNMVSRMHDVDEYIPVDNFLRGIDIYEAIIKRLANLPDGNENTDNCFPK